MWYRVDAGTRAVRGANTGWRDPVHPRVSGHAVGQHSLIAETPGALAKQGQDGTLIWQELAALAGSFAKSSWTLTGAETSSWAIM